MMARRRSWWTLALLLAALVPRSAEGCVTTVLQKGTLNDTELVAEHLLQLSPAGSCTCCALCHHYTDCASLSFSPASGVCRLYRSVPDFSRLTVDTESELYVRPGRSGHHQFCRYDSDCLLPDEACHGRVCTSDVTVTCRDLAETHGAPGNGLFYGSIAGTTMKLYCRETEGYAGWTRIGYFASGSNGGTGGWTRTNVVERNVGEPFLDYSILQLTDVLRQSGSEPRYRIRVLGQANTGSYRGFIGSLPVEQSLVVRDAVEAANADLQVEVDSNNYVSQSKAAGAFRLPWLPPTGNSLLSVNKPQSDAYYFRTMINVPGVPYFDDSPFKYVTYDIRE